QRFVFSTLHFAVPIVPTCHADERCTADPIGDAIDAKQRSNISTNRGRTECRDQLCAKQARVGLRSPRIGIAVGMYEQEAAATEVNRQRSFRRYCRTRSLSHSRTPLLWPVHARFETIRLLRAKRCRPKNRLSFG